MTPDDPRYMFMVRCIALFLLIAAVTGLAVIASGLCALVMSWVFHTPIPQTSLVLLVLMGIFAILASLLEKK